MGPDAIFPCSSNSNCIIANAAAEILKRALGRPYANEATAERLREPRGDDDCEN
jgi:hypothetical protein